MKLDIIDVNGSATGRQIELPEDIFGIEPNEHVLYLAVKQYQAHQRQGTHKAKERGEITGSTKKIKRQKGTGTARAGDIKSPVFRGGGRIFGPRPRNYSVKLNSKVKRLARLSALSSKINSESLSVVEDFTLDAPSTKSFKAMMDKISGNARSVLLVTGDLDKNIHLSSRNLSNASVCEARNINPYHLLNASQVVLSESAVEKIVELNSTTK